MIVFKGLILLNNFENNVDVWTSPSKKLAELDIDGKILTCGIKTHDSVVVGCHLKQISMFSLSDITIGGKVKALSHI